MAERKELGRISQASFGVGGYDDAMIGLSLTFSGEAWGVATFEGTWATRSERAQWSLEDQRNSFADAVILLRDTLTAAKKRDVSKLPGTPVEVTLEDNSLKSWRVLTEVL